MFHQDDPFNRDGQLRADAIRQAQRAAAAASVPSLGDCHGYASPLGQVIVPIPAPDIPVTDTPDTIFVRNDTGMTLHKWYVVGLGDPVATPTTNLADFHRRVAMIGVVPTADHVGKFAILKQVLAPGETGLAVVDGVTIAMVSGVVGDYVEAAIGNIQYLVPVSAEIQEGAAQVLWAESGSGPRHAIVRLTNRPLVHPPTNLLSAKGCPISSQTIHSGYYQHLTGFYPYDANPASGTERRMWHAEYDPPFWFPGVSLGLYLQGPGTFLIGGNITWESNPNGFRFMSLVSSFTGNHLAGSRVPAVAYPMPQSVTSIVRIVADRPTRIDMMVFQDSGVDLEVYGAPETSFPGSSPASLWAVKVSAYGGRAND